MKKMEVLKEPNPILRQVSNPVEISDITSQRIQNLIDDMIETMRVEKGVGIAAPQVGVNERIIIVDDGNEQQAFINPQITSRSLRKLESEEGCLSVPDVYGTVIRHKSVRLKALDRNGNKIKFKVKDFPSFVFQHEIDHLDGILFIDKMERKITPPSTPVL